jgi:hypothetical protein
MHSVVQSCSARQACSRPGPRYAGGRRCIGADAARDETTSVIRLAHIFNSVSLIVAQTIVFADIPMMGVLRLRRAAAAQIGSVELRCCAAELLIETLPREGTGSC